MATYDTIVCGLREQGTQEFASREGPHLSEGSGDCKGC